MTERILVVDDEADMCELIQWNLERAGYSVETAASGLMALSRISKARPDLVILDRMLPGLDGIAVCGEIRRDPATGDLPVIMLTALGDEISRVGGLDAGADDYLAKPFSMPELLARVRALLRRSRGAGAAGGSVLVWQELRYQPDERLLSCDGGEPVLLTPKEGCLLEFLLRNAGRHLVRDRIIDHVWDDPPEDPRALDVLVRRLRARLGACAGLLSTLPGTGYGLVENASSGGGRT